MNPGDIYKKKLRSKYTNTMKRGDLVYTNLFGEDNHTGILIDVRKLPINSLEFFSCKVLLTNGTTKRFNSSQLLTMKDIECNNVNCED